MILASFFVYFVRIGICYPPALPEMSAEEMLQFRQSCGLDASRAEQFSGFLLLFMPGLLFLTAYWLVRPPRANIQRSGPLASFLLLTLVDSLLLVVIVLLSIPGTGTGSGKPALTLAGIGFVAYIALLGIWQWRRWGLLVFQGVAVLLTIYSGLNGLSFLPAGVAFFSAIYLTMILRPLRALMD